MDNANMFALLVVWVAVSAALAFYAWTQGRPAGKWFFMALLLSPLLAVVLLRKFDDLPPPSY